MSRSISLLDCTLRDGGNGFEELYFKGNAEAVFDESVKSIIVSELKKSGIDIVEIGSIQSTSDDRRCFAQYQTIDELSATMPKEKEDTTLFAGIFRTPDEPISLIPEWRPGLCEATRVVLRYSELKKSLDFCEALANKGYKVFIQPMVTMRYTDNDLKMVIDAANRMGAYAVYFVDSYGCMDFNDVKRLSSIYSRELDVNIKVGFHAHNNLNMAFSNALCFVETCQDRDIIIDSCLLGMGLGAGNLQTELIVNYANKELGKKINLNHILRACEAINPLFKKGLWGYSLERCVPALQKVAYKYSTEYITNYNLSLSDIFSLLEGMPDDYRYRYTKEYAKEWYDSRIK